MGLNSANWKCSHRVGLAYPPPDMLYPPLERWDLCNFCTDPKKSKVVLETNKH